MAIGSDKTRKSITFANVDLEILEVVSAYHKRTPSNEIGYLIQTYLKEEYDELQKKKSK